MTESTPTAGAKRKVMGRMDVAQSDSPSSNITPTARPRIIRGPHGASSPGLANQAPSSGSRTAALGSARARVDMSAFASPTIATSSTGNYSPSMSPSVSASQSRPFFATASSAGHMNRGSAQSPSLRPGPFAGHVRANSTLGTSSPSTKSNDSAVGSTIQRSDSFNFRSPRIRSKTDEAEFTASSSFASPTVASPMTASTSARVLAARAPPPSVHRASAPHLITKAPNSGFTPTPRASLRPPMSPQRKSRDDSTFSPRVGSRDSSPPTSAESVTTRPSLQQAASSDPQRQQTLEGKTSLSAAAQNRESASDTYSTPTSHTHDISQPTNNPSGQVLYPSATASPHAMPDTMRTHSRTQSSLSGLKRASIPTALQTFGHTLDADGPMSPTSPTTWTFARPPMMQQRSSFASSTASASIHPLLSPGLSETPVKTPAEVAAAEEARIHRKLLDLEITNKSLMAINSSLEVTKLKQAREIRELKRRLREGGRSLSVDPHGANTSIHDESDDDDSDSCASSTDEDDHMPFVREDPELEAAHVRCKALIDNMLVQARKSILHRHEIKEASTGGKVLHPAEIEQMLREQDEGNESQQPDQSGVSRADEETVDESSMMSLDTSTGDISASVLSMSLSPSASSDRSSSSTDRMLGEGNTSSSTSNLSIEHERIPHSDSALIEHLLATPKFPAEYDELPIPSVLSAMPTQAMPGDVSID